MTPDVTIILFVFSTFNGGEVMRIRGVHSFAGRILGHVTSIYYEGFNRLEREALYTTERFSITMNLRRSTTMESKERQAISRL